MKRVYTNWCQSTSALMSNATMLKSRQRYVPKFAYLVSVLLFKNILLWRNDLYFIDVPRNRKSSSKNYRSIIRSQCKLISNLFVLRVYTFVSCLFTVHSELHNSLLLL